MKYFLYALTLLFVAFKLIGTIAWSWWLVLLPLYGGLVVWVALAVLAFVAGMIGAAMSTRS